MNTICSYTWNTISSFSWKNQVQVNFSVGKVCGNIPLGHNLFVCTCACVCVCVCLCVSWLASCCFSKNTYHFIHDPIVCFLSWCWQIMNLGHLVLRLIQIEYTSLFSIIHTESCFYMCKTQWKINKRDKKQSLQSSFLIGCWPKPVHNKYTIFNQFVNLANLHSIAQFIFLRRLLLLSHLTEQRFL